jgi:hypothetical protein
VPGQERVDARTDEHRRAYDGDREPWMGLRRAAGEPLDLQQVGDDAFRPGPQRGVLVERHGVVGQRTVDHRARTQHDPGHATGRGGGEHGLGAAYVASAALPAVGVRHQVEVEMDDGRAPGDPLRDRGVTHIEHPPLRAVDVAPPFVDRDHPLDLFVIDQRLHQGMPDPRRSSGDRDDQAFTSGARRLRGRTTGSCAPPANRSGFVAQVRTSGK